MNDNLDTSMFNTVNRKTSENRDTIKNLHVYKPSKPVIKAKLTKLIAVVITVLGGALIVNGLRHSKDYEKVLHGRDYASDGTIYRIEDLNEETWAADYKYVNENATVDDAVLAYGNGQYNYYINNDGEVKVEQNLQGNIQAKETNATDYYNTVCTDFADQVLGQLDLEQSNQK